MSRSRRPKGNPFPFLPVPKKMGTAVLKPVAQKAPTTALVKVSPSEIKPIPVSNDDRMSYQIYQQGQGIVDQKAFQIQKTEDGWRACAVWSVEGKGEVPNFVKKLSCNLDVFNDVFNLGMRLDPEVKMEAVDGGLFACDRAVGDPIGNMLRQVIGTVRQLPFCVGNIGEEDEFIEEDMP